MHPCLCWNSRNCRYVHLTCLSKCGRRRRRRSHNNIAIMEHLGKSTENHAKNTKHVEKQKSSHWSLIKEHGQLDNLPTSGCGKGVGCKTWRWGKTLQALALEVRNLKIWYQGLDDTCWWTTIINQQSTSFPKWWFQILSWNHQLEPLTTFRTRTVGLATSLSSCFYTIRLEWHLDDWGKSCHSFWFRIWCVCFSSKHSVCILCGIYTVYISVYKYTYIHVYVCKSTMHPYTGIPIHKYV